MKIQKFNERIHTNNDGAEEVEDENFFISRDGWNKEDLVELVDWLASAEKLAYEIRNARRGSYALDGDQPEDLLAYMKNLSGDLENLIGNYEDEMEMLNRFK